ncbi:MAG: ferritin-like domain-containing protein [Pseudonocardiaceae bacterium]
MTDPESLRGKIFPRNLTARADHVVRGNPAGSRPESGVDNCYPGLEFDQRNLDTAFFPGLLFEFHRPDGARLRSVGTTGSAAEQGLRDADLPLYLWAVCGRTTVDQDEANAPTFTCTGLDGLEVWRRVHDLLPGAVAVLLGPTPGVGSPGSDAVGGSLNGFRQQGRSTVQRDAAGAVEAAVLVAPRARYLDDGGVIDPEVYLPGELTRSLCAPWQYDFRDCGCFYWAASKPDIVTSSDGRFPNLNFQRRDRTSVPPPTDVVTLAGRSEQELDYAELVSDWNSLPVVINDRENDSLGLPPAPAVKELTRKQVLKELDYLATVEHALCVEYLFAHYSLAAPMQLPPTADPTTRRVFAAAAEVFSIAIDEMRHFRWVNEALVLLSRPPNIGRADRIHRQLDRPFVLKPLTADQLDWFLEIERPSQSIATGIDGMYVRLLTTIDRRPDLFPERDRLVHLLKLIINEGIDHFQRFTAVKEQLTGLAPERYLRPLNRPADQLARGLIELSNQNYAVLLGALSASFTLGDRAGGALLEQSRRAMFSLHETNHVLAARGVAPPFTLPGKHKLPGAKGVRWQSALDEQAGAVRQAQQAVTELGGAPEHELVLRQQAAHEELFASMRSFAPATPPDP